MTVSPPRSTARRFRVAALAVLVASFLAGALAGVAYERTLGRPAAGSRHGGPARMFAPDGALGERLRLSAGQRREIEAILREDRQQADAIFHDLRPQLHTLFDSTTQRIRATLTPEQQRDFDRYVEERREAYRRRRAEHDSEDTRP